LSGKPDVYWRCMRMVSFLFAMTFAQRAFAQETAITRLDLPLGRAYPYRAAEVITRVTVANPAVADAVVVSEREIARRCGRRRRVGAGNRYQRRCSR
jgi:hypothetical protein